MKIINIKKEIVYWVETDKAYYRRGKNCKWVYANGVKVVQTERFKKELEAKFNEWMKQKHY